MKIFNNYQFPQNELDMQITNSNIKCIIQNKNAQSRDLKKNHKYISQKTGLEIGDKAVINN